MKLLARGGHALLRLVVPLGLALALPPRVSMAAECGSSGNTHWTFNGVAPIEHAVVGDLGIYVVAGTKLSLLDLVTGAEITSRDFVTVTLGRPIVFTLKSPVNGASREVVVAGSDGIVYGLHPSTLADNWTRSTRRSICTADAITAAPVAQLWESSDSTFRATRSTDVVLVGTHYKCGTTTANKVYGLNAETGAVVWIFNATGTSYSMDAVRGLAVDYARNTVHLTSAKADPGITQATARGLNSMTGAQRWAQDFGDVASEPVLAAKEVFAGGRLYVATRAGALTAVNPATGLPLWSTTVVVSGSQVTTRPVAAPIAGSAYVPLYVVDTGGTLHALLDDCSGAPGVVWSAKPAGSAFSTAPAVNLGAGKVYIGAADGRAYQIDATTGLHPAYATISAAAASCTPLVLLQESLYNTTPRLLAGAGDAFKKLCIPWADTPGDYALRQAPPGLDLVPSSGFLGLRFSIPTLARDRHAPSRVHRAGS